MIDSGWKSPTGPVGGNCEPKATARYREGAWERSRMRTATERKVKPREADLVEASVLRNLTPDIQPGQDGMGDGSGRILIVLTPRGLSGSARAVGREIATTV